MSGDESVKARKREWYLENRERVLAARKKAYSDNREAERARRKEYFLKNRDRIIEAQRRDYADNPEKHREYHKKYYALHRAERLEYQKAYDAARRKKLAAQRKAKGIEPRQPMTREERNKYARDYYHANKDRIRAQQKKYYMRKRAGEAAKPLNRKKKWCNRDCFNCIYPDCIW